mmetsp:Transcript_44913/g.84308  ORF Transcript_44913/g.84308 Transcript_44913/m.84308 type:complete len:249 (+) Transcript_44913:3-749(+)
MAPEDSTAPAAPPAVVPSSCGGAAKRLPFRGSRPGEPIRASAPLMTSAMGRSISLQRAPRSPRTPQHAMMEWQVRKDVEQREIASCIDALYRQRKATLRFLRRCEDARELLALQDVLDPQPRITHSASGRRLSSPRGLAEALPPQQLAVAAGLQPGEERWLTLGDIARSRCGTPGGTPRSTPRGTPRQGTPRGMRPCQAPFAFAMDSDKSAALSPTCAGILQDDKACTSTCTKPAFAFASEYDPSEIR